MDQQVFTGERSLFKSRDLLISHSIFTDGESPLKESSEININDSIFRWKYPLWYCENIQVKNSSLLEMARSGIWYTHRITIEDSIIAVPKTFRRSSDIHLSNVSLPDAEETLWNCKDIYLNNVTAKGDYFAMNSENIEANSFSLIGNYAFDGAKNIEIHNSKIISKDAFWNCENVTVYNSVIIGEYLGWNSKNITFIDCTIESNQGMCYMDNLVIENGKIINTDLAFEYSTVEIESTTEIVSVKNPISGKIKAPKVEELILDDDEIEKDKTQFIFEKVGGHNAV